MRQQESEVAARFIFSRLDIQEFKVCINLGCGNIEDLRKKKPWINNHIFDRLRQAGLRVINVDRSNYSGIDVVCDLDSSDSFDFLTGLPAPRLLIFANVVEHLSESSRNHILGRLYSSMGVGDALLVTAPFDYPYHPDPIDTMFRPSPPELAKAIPLKWIEQTIVSAGSYKQEFLSMSPLKRLRKLIRPFWPLQSFGSWRRSLRILWLFKPYRITVILGIKQP
jgi:hypothetical protein